MGLFDGYFDTGTYGGNQGGLIDRLLAGLQQQGAYQPSNSFPANPMDANASAPMNPIAVGNYQMPRIGDPSLYQPQETALPPNAQPVQGQLPPAPQQPMPMMPQYQSPGGFGSAMRGAVANMQGGPLGMIGGALAGAMGMGQGTPQQQQQALILQNYRAMVAAGVPERQAMLAAINPEAAKAIIPAQFGADNLAVTQTGENDLGQKTFQVFNKKTGEFSPVPNAPGSQPSPLGDTNKTGAAYLATLPPDQAGTVKAMVEGRLAPPSSFAMGKPYWQKMISAAQAYDPTFDATNWSGRVAGVRDFSAGKSAEMVRSANQTLHHVGELLTSMDNLHNRDNRLANFVGNTYAEFQGSGAQGAFRTNAHAVAEELSKVFKGSNLSDAEIHAWEQNLHENMSPEQQRAQVAKLRDLLKGSLDALEEKRINSIGPMAAEKQGPLIKEEGQRVLDRLNAWVNQKPGTEAAPSLKVGQTATVGNVSIKKVKD